MFQPNIHQELESNIFQGKTKYIKLETNIFQAAIKYVPT